MNDGTPLPRPDRQHPGLRRRELLLAMAAAGILPAVPSRAAAQVGEVLHNQNGLSQVRVGRVHGARSTQDVAQAVRAWAGPLCIGGARYSMGGQIAAQGGLHLDMRSLAGLVWLDPQRRVVRVQAGMCWRDLQEVLDPLDLAVRTMQSYANFSIGGSVSVNVHGRYVGHGAIGASVRALQIVLAGGEVLECDREHRAELFRAAIGGYGGVGAITQVELDLDRNVALERRVHAVPLADYPAFVHEQVLRGGRCVLHNADLAPPDFDRPVAVSWFETDSPVTHAQRLVPRGQRWGVERAALRAVTELPGGDRLQNKLIRPALRRGHAVVWRNHEASLDVASLAPESDAPYCYALQEYFVPVGRFISFVHKLRSILQRHGARVLNISIRHAPADRDAVLAWAREPVLCFVLFYPVARSAQPDPAVQAWCRALIDAALEEGGSFYLPYQRHATRAQFEAAYPQAAEFRRIKSRLDPQGRWRNALWQDYL